MTYRNSFQAFSRKIRIQYFIFSFYKPILISIWIILGFYLLNKILHHEILWWVHCLSVLVAGIFLTIGVNRFRKFKIEKSELDAVIDMKSKAGGAYMALMESGQNAEFQKYLVNEEVGRKAIPIKFDFSWLMQYFVISLFVLLVMLFPQKILNTYFPNQENWLLMEKKDLETLKENEVIDEKEEQELKKEIAEIEESINNEGVTKENWERKQALNKKMEELFKEQQFLEQLAMKELSKIADQINQGEELDKLMNDIAKMEKSLMNKEGATKELNKILEQLGAGAQELLKKSAGESVDKEMLQKMMQNLQQMQQILKNQNFKRSECRSASTGSPFGEEMDKNLGEGLKELAEKLKDAEKAECKNGIVLCEIPGEGGINRGPGSSEIKFTNQNQDESSSSKTEKLNSKETFNHEGETLKVEEGKHDEYIIDKNKNETKVFTDTKTDLIFKEELKPHRKEIIKKYFKK